MSTVPNNDTRTPAEKLLDETHARWLNQAIIEAAMTALRAFYLTEPGQVAPMLAFWIRRDEMTDADVAEVAERMFPKRLDRMPCPSWCDQDHSEEFQPNEVENLADHYHDLLTERDEAGRLKLWVAIHATDDLTERQRYGGGIHVQADETLSPDQAIRMIAAVTEGLRILAA